MSPREPPASSLSGAVGPSRPNTPAAAHSATANASAPSVRPSRERVGPITVGRLKWVSFTHSCIYTALLVCAFAVSKPEPLTFVLGLTHGLLWIGMSITCIACVRLRLVSLRLAVAVAVLGGIGPFFGSYEFVREQRRQPRDATGSHPVNTL